MSIEGADTETQGKIVVLITQLLKLIEAAFPKRTHLYFGALSTNNSVCTRIVRSRNIKTLESQVT